MKKVYVLQADNRPSIDYLLKTQKVNKKFCDILGYDYLFLNIDNNEYGNIHPATKKIHIINDFLHNTTCDIVVFLDSDAWIQNGFWLNDLITPFSLKNGTLFYSDNFNKKIILKNRLYY